MSGERKMVSKLVTIEEAVDRILEKINLKLVVVFIAMLCTVINTGAVTCATIYTGYIPYHDWECNSTKCFDLQTKAEDAEDTDKFFSYETMCENDLVAGSDFKWTSKMHTFSMDWHLYCGREAIFSLLNGAIGLGSLIGLLMSTGLYDRIGRKKGGIVGSVISVLSVAACSVAPNYQVLFFLRLMSGFGIFVNFTGTFCWIAEYAPTRLRMAMSVSVSLGWCAGLYATICLSYLISDWQNVFLGIAAVNIFSLLTYFLIPLPESPRFSLIQGKREEAKKTLKRLASISNSNVDVDSLDLMFEKRKEYNYFEQLKDLKKYPNMLKQTLQGLWVWFTVALIAYSSNYGWSKLGSDLYATYCFSALSEAIAYSTSVFVCGLLGRKKSIIFYLVMMILMNFLAMVDVQFSSAWSLELVAGLVGYVATSAALNMLWLFSAELAPTSHRGMIICLSSSAARLGSFIGPYTSLMYGVTDRKVPLALFAGFTMLACVAMWFLPDTTDRSIAETPKDVELMARGKREEKDEEEGDESDTKKEGMRRRKMEEMEGVVMENSSADSGVLL